MEKFKIGSRVSTSETIVIGTITEIDPQTSIAVVEWDDPKFCGGVSETRTYEFLKNLELLS